MLTVALTGNVAAGKTAVAELWRGEGVPIVGADELAREVVAPGTDGLVAVRQAFGDGVIGADGALDRAAMRDLVFREKGARERLEALLHPRIDQLRRSWMKARELEGAALAAAEIPLLFEAGLQGDFDVVVLVDAPAELRLERLVRERGLDPLEARRIMDAQMDPNGKRALADVVLENGGSLEELRASALSLLGELRRRTAGP